MKDIFSLPPKQVLLKVLLPISFAFVMIVFIDFADIFVAKMLTKQEVAVLGVCYPLVYFMMAIGFGLNQGLTIVGSEAFVQKGRESLYHLVLQAMIIAAFLALLLQIVTHCFIYYEMVSPCFLKHMTEIKVYLFTVVSAVLPVFFVLILCAVCQIEGKVNIVRDTLGLMLLLTYIIHPIFALPFGLHLRLKGIAISKIVVFIIGAIYAAARVIYWDIVYKMKFRLDIEKLGFVMQQSFPAIVIQMLVPSYLIVLTSMISQLGVDQVAGFALGYRIVMTAVLPILGILTALLVIVTHDFLLKRYDRIKEIISLSLRWGAAIIWLTLGLTYIASYTIFTWFGLSSVELIALRYIQLAMYITVLEFGIGVITVLFQSVKKPLMAFFVAMTRTTLFPLPLFYYLSQGGYTLDHIGYGLILSFTLSALVSFLVGYYQLWSKLNTGIETIF